MTHNHITSISSYYILCDIYFISTSFLIIHYIIIIKHMDTHNYQIEIHRYNKLNKHTSYTLNYKIRHTLTKNINNTTPVFDKSLTNHSYLGKTTQLLQETEDNLIKIL
jgi:hypothetical protein